MVSNIEAARRKPPDNDDALAQQFFDEIDAEGRMISEKMAEHYSAFELIAKLQSIRTQLDTRTKNLRVVEPADEAVLKSLVNYEAAMTEALVSNGGFRQAVIDAGDQAHRLKGEHNKVFLEQLKSMIDYLRSDTRNDAMDTATRLEPYSSAQVKDMAAALGVVVVYLRSLLAGSHREESVTLLRARFNVLADDVAVELRKREGSVRPSDAVLSYGSTEDAVRARQAEAPARLSDDEEDAGEAIVDFDDDEIDDDGDEQASA